MSNNKQQTEMKLYTEEQVRKAIELSRDTHPQGMGYVVKDVYDYSMDEVVDLLTPIELPSHYEIWEEAIKEELNQRRYDFMRGADFVRDKIQGGTNDKQ
jgi:hypothetical protein